MAGSLLRTDKEITDIYTRHVDMIYRICYAYMKNPADTEDAVQDTFLKLINYKGVFKNSEHEKAWLIVTASNLCRNYLRHWWRKRENLDDYDTVRAAELPKADETFRIVMSLPDRYKTSIYLYYYEGYTSAEIAGMLHKPKSTIRNYLHEGRQLLRKKLGDDFDEK